MIIYQTNDGQILNANVAYDTHIEIILKKR